MVAEINNVIYMKLNSGPKIANSTCGKTIDVEKIDRDSTVYIMYYFSILTVCNFLSSLLSSWHVPFFRCHYEFTVHFMMTPHVIPKKL